MMKRNKNAPKSSIEKVNPSSNSKTIDLHDSEGKSSSEDVRNTSNVLKNKQKETNTTEIFT